jgi:hypothetical protein
LLESDNFLMRLARQNRGLYRYWDIEEVAGPESMADEPPLNTRRR